MAKKQLNTRNSVPNTKQTPTQAAAPKRGFRIDWMIVAFILLATAVIYWPSLNNAFTTFDDNVYVYENQNIECSASNLKVLATKEVAGNFHPLTMWSLALDHQKIGNKGTDPKPYHRTNLLLHLLNTALVFGLIRRLRFSIFVSSMVALLFAIHPMHTESVAWVSSRKDLLYSVFFLSGLIAHTYHQAAETKARSIRIWMGAFVLFVLACMSKPAAIIFPLVLWLMDWYQDPETAKFSKQLRKYAPFLAVSAVFSYLTFQYQHQVGAVADGYFSMIQKTLFAAYGYVIYVVKLFFPTHLSAFHPIPEQGTNQSIMYTTLVVGCGLFGGTVWAFLKGHRLWAFGLTFYLINLILVLGFVKVGSALYAERYTYMSYVGLFLILSVLAERYFQKGGMSQVVSGALAGLFVFLFGWQTREQIKAWKDADTMWTQVIKEYPQAKNYAYRGHYYFSNGRYDKALADFEKACELNPEEEITAHIRAVCLQKLGKNKEAIDAFAGYEKKFPPKAPVLLSYAEALNAQSRIQEAISKFEKALELDPQNIEAWTNLSASYFTVKDYAKAEACLTKALAINPDYIPALNNRGACRLAIGAYAGAIIDFDRSLKLNPNQQGIIEYRKRCEGK